MKMSHTILKKDNFIQKLKNYFAGLPFEVKDKNLCVCLSGGADSMALLNGLLILSEELSFSVSACHFNHLIRGEEAYRDEEFCKDFCNRKGIKIYCGRDDVPQYASLKKMSVEQAARECRYAFFERVLAKQGVDYCVTAHNMNDDAETLLFNLVRGTGMNGTSAIAPMSEHYIRPMLKITRDEIIEFLTSNGITYVVDSTNFSDEYTRNFIRNVVFPELMKVNPSVINSFSRFIDSSRCDREYFENTIAEYMDSDLRKFHKSLRVRIISRKFKLFCGENLNYELTNELDSLLFSEERIIIPIYNSYEAIINNGNLSYFKIDSNNVKYNEFILSDGINISDNNIVCIEISEDNLNLQKNINKISTTQQLSFDNICGNIFVRTRMVGDKITIKGINKSLKKLFIDKKVPKEYRDIIPIICDEEGIIYVPFVGIADRVFPKDSDKKRFINITFNTIDKERWGKI